MWADGRAHCRGVDLVGSAEESHWERRQFLRDRWPFAPCTRGYSADREVVWYSTDAETERDRASTRVGGEARVDQAGSRTRRAGSAVRRRGSTAVKGADADFPAPVGLSNDYLQQPS